MSSLAHRSRQRRAERSPLTAHGNINLVPLVDILTSIVFFSLLTYQGAVSQLTAYDLTLPPTVITQEQAKQGSQDPGLTLLLAVKLVDDNLQVEHSEEGGFKQVIRGMTPQSYDQLEALMTQIHQKYPQNNDVLVVPSDESSYDNVVKVLERLRLARYANISLGSRARGTQVASAATR